MPSTPFTPFKKKTKTWIEREIEMRPIANEEEYELAVERLESLWDAAPGSAEAIAGELIAEAIEEYEQRQEDLF